MQIKLVSVALSNCVFCCRATKPVKKPRVDDILEIKVISQSTKEKNQREEAGEMEPTESRVKA